MKYYDFPELYDLFYSDAFEEECLNFYKVIFAKKKFQEVLDCSVGTGKMLLPMAKLGYSCTGSDINQNMIRQAKINFAKENMIGQFILSDYNELSKNIKRNFDCVMCTGNSLAHAKNEQLENVISQMDKMLRPGGTLYIDSRNWDNILKRKQRFYLFNPVVRDKGRVNYVQVWDYNKNGSIIFNYLIFEELDNKIVSKRQFYEFYYPFSIETLKQIIEKLNYQNIKVTKLGDSNSIDLEQIDWYALTAEKPIEGIGLGSKLHT
ncbi:MAG: methyltransferase domain-containing protein [Candidatus Cloacimonadales bacterium]|jgi:ubiquinone/menaquinone biosynthesis C-methylase UbiE|nr:class I SAM-dependent methyltransferase [Candidatus Cloacimonadota bacterium]MDD2650867.1 methyltransferase domain-containing protein [Candidatus Cloacimonadota bacterium]MDD3500980.1 methyltransferase domain-containing protein [Candidatus Cloacimonadota bacterium]MDX9977156.1 methyltransferase domain-containing protein [Candidatus Cloacimonadales bacterium]